MILPAGWRAALARSFLVLLLGAEMPRDSLREAPARVSRAASSGRGSAGEGESFWFDPAYARFVEAVRLATPETATIELAVPRTIDLYVYRAVYGLVPRRVVAPEEGADAQYVAVYGNSIAPPIGSGTTMPGGLLLRR